jgi:N-dimethylarginine dimethylaminohydrolase
MPKGKTINILPEDLLFSPPNIQNMNSQELLEEHRRRIQKAPGITLGQPPRTWEYQEVDYKDELEQTWGRKWGSQGIGKLREIVLPIPSENELWPFFYEDPAYTAYPSFATGEMMREWGKPELKLWQDQYEKLVEAFNGEGVTVHQVKLPEPAMGPYGLIMGTSWGTQICVINGGAIIQRNCFPSMRGGEVIYRKVLDQLGVPILYTVRGKGVGEIAGGIWLDDHHYVVSDCYPINWEAITQLRPIYKMSESKFIVLRTSGPLYDFTFPGGGLTHPDTFVSFPQIGLAVLCTLGVPYSFVKFLKRLKFEIIEVPPHEYSTNVINMIPLRPGKVIVPAEGKITIREMEKKGIDVIPIPYTEQVKMGGAIHCVTGQLVRDSGPIVEELEKHPLEELAPELV